MDKVQPTHMVHCRAILIRYTAPNVKQPDEFKPHTEAEALAIIDDVQKQLKAGKDFGDLAKQYSEDTASKDKGGDVGLAFDGANLDETLLRAALSLDKGKITENPVKVNYGYYLIQVVSTSDSHPASEDSSYAAAQDKYRRQQAQYLVPDYMKTLRAQAKIVNYLP
jgi:foldase protein PrsA